MLLRNAYGVWTGNPTVSMLVAMLLLDAQGSTKRIMENEDGIGHSQ